MYNTEQEVSELRIRINQEKEMVKRSIKNGAIFDEVKDRTLRIKEMERKLKNLEMAQKSLENKS
jgi:hypothetical protein